MIIKSSSNRKHYLFIGALVFFIALVIFFTKDKHSKYEKYPPTPAFKKQTPLDLLQITINEKHYKKLKAKRDKAISVGILESNNNDYVPATITFNGLSYKAEIRLKGDWTDHLKGDKWSFRIKLKGNKTILGMRKFSIHHPKTRNYLNEWLYHKIIKKAGLIGLRYEFVEGSLHIKNRKTNEYINKPLGIYALEESFDKRLLENNKRKESVILKFSEDYWWNEVKKSLNITKAFGLKWNRFIRPIDYQYPVRVFSERKILKDSLFNNYFKIAKHLVNGVLKEKVSLNSAFDTKKLAMQNAILNLFGAKHGNYSINLRFYYNPISSKLEPISYDGNSGYRLDNYVDFYLASYLKKEDTIYLKELMSALDKVSKSEYLDQILMENQKEISRYKKILKIEFNKSDLLSEKNIEYNQQKIIKDELSKLKKKFNLPATKMEIKEFKFNTPDFTKWRFVRSTSSKLKSKYKEENVYTIKRETIHKNALVVIDNIKVNYGYNYEVSIIARKGQSGYLLGMRIQGDYPNRVDAVFDLEKGIVKGVSKSGYFDNPSATIESLGKGWYKCVLSGKVYAHNIKILFGATGKQNKIPIWESPANKLFDINIVPASLQIKQKTLN